MNTMKAVVFRGTNRIAIEDLSPLVTHKFALDDIHEAFELFSHQRDGVLRVALYPDASRVHAALVAAAKRSEHPGRTAS